MGISAGRPEYIEMSWDEYCCLTQSKLLAVNILSFRDYTNTQSGPRRYHTIVPSQYRTAHTATGNTCPFRTNTTNIPNNLSYAANNLNNGPSFPVPPPYNDHFGNRNCTILNPTNIQHHSGNWYHDPSNPQRISQNQTVDNNQSTMPTQGSALGQFQQPSHFVQRPDRHLVMTQQPQASTRYQQSADESNISSPQGGRSSDGPTTTDVINASVTRNTYPEETMSEYEADEEAIEHEYLGHELLSPIIQGPPASTPRHPPENITRSHFQTDSIHSGGGDGGGDDEEVADNSQVAVS